MSDIKDDWRPVMQMSPHATYRHRVAAHELTDRITPTSDVFVLAHFGVAHIHPDAWRLQVTGMVKRPAEISLRQLRELPKVDLEAFIKVRWVSARSYDCHSQCLERGLGRGAPVGGSEAGGRA